MSDKQENKQQDNDQQELSSKVEQNRSDLVTKQKRSDFTKKSKPKTDPLLDMKLKEELSKIAMNQLNFFRAINQCYTELLINDQYSEKRGNSKQFWEDIIIDYEQYMVKLAEDINITIPMSLEIELIWRIHLLSPQNYINDCMRQFGKIIGHYCIDPKMKYIRHNSSKFRKEILKNLNPGNTGFIGPDLIMTDALKRQCKFIRKIIKINMFNPIDKNKINSSIARYEKFLETMWAENKPQGLIMVPTLDIDLIYHLHQLNIGLCNYGGCC